MKSLAVCIVRNAGDFIALAVLHHLLAGVDICIVIDNGSSDATPEILKAIARKVPRLVVIDDPSPFDQSKIRNDAIREFIAKEKTIVIPFDSDEVWSMSVPGLVRKFAELDANVLLCDVLNFIQSRSVVQPSRWSWLRAYRRAPVRVGANRKQVIERESSFVEIPFNSKVVFMAEAAAQVDIGAHHVLLEGKKQQRGPFACLHLPLRSRAELTKRAHDNELRRAPFRTAEGVSWQSKYWHDAVLRGEEEQEWRANSYDSDGYLDVYGRRAKTFFDFRMVLLLSRAYAYGLYLGVPMGAPPAA